MAKRFFSPLLVSGVEDVEKGTVEIHVTNDLQEMCAGELSWELTTTGGKVVLKDPLPADILPGQNIRAHILNCTREIREYGVRDLMLRLNLTVDGKGVSDNFVSFARLKHLELPKPNIGLEIRIIEDKIRVMLTSETPALWVWLELDGMDARYSDNFFHLWQGHPVSVEITPEEKISPVW